MPEIKHVFNQGKMNKDLDERLVPNGQYRDAMNVQISTSDSSDVGAIENVLGNKLLMSGNEIGDSAYCVGAVADEKNDALYWLVSGSVYLGLNEEISRDMILQYKDGKVTPVVVDIYRIRTLYANHDATANTVMVGFNDPNKDFIEVVENSRSDKLKKDSGIELFSGEFWSGRKAKELGLIDGIGNADKILKEKFGDDVIIKKFEKQKGWIARKLSSESHTDKVISIIEERSIWQRYGF